MLGPSISDSSEEGNERQNMNENKIGNFISKASESSKIPSSFNKNERNMENFMEETNRYNTNDRSLQSSDMNQNHTTDPTNAPAENKLYEEEGSKPMRTSGSIANVVTNMANIITPAIEQTFSKTSPSSSKQLESENSSFNINHESKLSKSSIDDIEIFEYINAYKPENIEIKFLLKPFLLDYIPAIGDVDTFIKIPRPDGVEDNLGLTVLDEPAIQQSDPTIVGMQLRNECKEIKTETLVKKLDRGDKNGAEIERWIENIKELHRSKPPDSVTYTKIMPDIEKLMQEWPNELEELLKSERLPSASLDVSLEEYTDICLSLLDIPVYKSRIESLHVLFTLFAEFRNSQHFRNLAENNLMNMNMNEVGAERLEL